MILTNKKDGYTNVELNNICKELQIPLIGIFMKDELNANNTKNGNYIINLQNSNQDGSHWCAFRKENKTVLYMDPFGIIMPNNDMLLFHKQFDSVFYSKFQIQDYKSSLCGLYCILFLFIATYDTEVSLLNRLSRFIKLFNTNKKKLKQNDKILLENLNYLLS